MGIIYSYSHVLLYCFDTIMVVLPTDIQAGVSGYLHVNGIFFVQLADYALIAGYHFFDLQIAFRLCYFHLKICFAQFEAFGTCPVVHLEGYIVAQTGYNIYRGIFGYQDYRSARIERVGL